MNRLAAPNQQEGPPGLGRFAVRLVIGGGIVFGIGAAILFAYLSATPSGGATGKSAPALTEIFWKIDLLKKADETGSKDQDRWPLRVMSGSAEPMPSEIERRAKRTLGAGFDELGIDFGATQSLETPPGTALWIAEGNGIVCIFEKTAAAVACDVRAELQRSGLVLVLGRHKGGEAKAKLPEQFMSLGVVPDGVRAVRLDVLDGTTRTVSVEDNVFGVQTGAPSNIAHLQR